MFTPQRKPWLGTDRKGKAVAFADEITTPSPPVSLLREVDGRFGAVDDWRKFKEVGLLDEASLERKDRDALIEKILKLEKEVNETSDLRIHSKVRFYVCECFCQSVR